jgi:dolichol-phosphate mannosyltransferase
MISVVIPCFNESQVLLRAYEAIREAAETWGDDCEILLIDDGSTDDTWSIIESLARRDVRVRGIRLLRNFGQQAALGAGLERVRGDVVAILDADLQDPPGLIGPMLEKWRQGYDVVYARRTRREGETWFKKFTSVLFYRIQERLCNVPIPRDAGDFSLLDVRVARTLAAFREHALFYRGLRTWSGFRETAVLFDRPPRAAGETKYTVGKMVRLASIALLNFSDLPLRLALYAGGLSLALTLLATLGSLAVHAAGIAGVPLGPLSGWALGAAPLAMFFLGAVQLICLGIMGEYLNRIYDEVRDRPRWIVATTIGATEPAQAHADSPRRKAG